MSGAIKTESKPDHPETCFLLPCAHGTVAAGLAPPHRGSIRKTLEHCSLRAGPGSPANTGDQSSSPGPKRVPAGSHSLGCCCVCANLSAAHPSLQPSVPHRSRSPEPHAEAAVCVPTSKHTQAGPWPTWTRLSSRAAGGEGNVKLRPCGQAVLAAARAGSRVVPAGAPMGT